MSCTPKDTSGPQSGLRSACGIAPLSLVACDDALLYFIVKKRISLNAVIFPEL
jgi:hypothetical protein